MKNKFKKLTIGLLSTAVVAGATSPLVGCSCSEADELQVMTMSVNPGVEFIVDKDDKVVSVTASNEDGAYILNNFENFTGMSAKDAAVKFLELSEQYGFVVSGTVDGEEITISVSGEGADELYKDVKKAISSKVTELGMEIKEMVKIAESDLENMIEECYQEYTSSEIADLSEEKMLEMLKASREETKELFTEDERLEYYKDRAQKILETKIATIEAYVESMGTIASTALSTTLMPALNVVKESITTAYNAVDTALNTALSQIKTQRETYITKKKEYLEKVEAYKEALEADNEALATELKTELTNLRAEAKGYQDELMRQLKTAKTELIGKVQTQVQTLLTSLNTAVDNILKGISNLPGVTPLSEEDINTAINNALTALKTEHENKATNPWGTTAQE